MAMSSVDLLVPGAKIYVADSTATAFPANTVDYGTAWGAGWTDLGWTKESTKLVYEMEVARLKVQQSMSAIRLFKTSETARIETVLAEFTGQSLKYALDASLTSVAQGSGVAASETIDVGGNTALTVRRWGFEGMHVDANGVKLPVRLFFYKGVITSGLEAEFGTEDYTGVPLKVEAVPDTTLAAGAQLFKVVKITAAEL